SQRWLRTEDTYTSENPKRVYYLSMEFLLGRSLANNVTNLLLFGLTAEEVAGNRGWYNPRWHYEHEPETRAALDLISSDHFSRYEPGVFAPLLDAVLTGGDYYMHLADLRSYLDADSRLVALYADPDAWARKAILNIAASGVFSSDRTIAQYATEIWNVKSCPVVPEDP
ncbi:MAG: glycogen/starch/alpha-glucan phosphorylase, partial [Thermoguttaceae bacterium]